MNKILYILRDCFGDDFRMDQLENRLQTLCAEKHAATAEVERLRAIIDGEDPD